MWAFLLFGLFVLVASSPAAEVNSLEDLKIDELLKSEDQRRTAFACLMDQGPCGQLQKLRDSLPEMIQTNCSQCTPKQKEKFDQISKMLFEKYPSEFQALSLKYSPRTD